MTRFFEFAAIGRKQFRQAHGVRDKATNDQSTKNPTDNRLLANTAQLKPDIGRRKNPCYALIMNAQWSLHTISDDALITQLTTLVTHDRQLLANVLAHIAEVDARKLYCAYAYPSMFRYVVDHLGFSEAAARHRIGAARLARRFPAIFDAVSTGTIHLSGLHVLATHLTEANHVELLTAALNKSKRDIEQLIAARFPRSDVLPMLVALPQGTQSDPSAAMPSTDSAATTSTGAAATCPNGTSATQARPLSADSFCATFTISAACHDKFVQAQALLRHSLPSGDMGAIFERSLDALLPALRKRKHAETTTPRTSVRDTKATSRHIPAEVKRKVVERDGGRCTFVGVNGRRCNEQAWAQFHHDKPFGRGGPPTVPNIRVLCAAHNRYQAELDYGRAHINKRVQQNRDQISGGDAQGDEPLFDSLRAGDEPQGDDQMCDQRRTGEDQRGDEQCADEPLCAGAGGEHKGDEQIRDQGRAGEEPCGEEPCAEEPLRVGKGAQVRAQLPGGDEPCADAQGRDMASIQLISIANNALCRLGFKKPIAHRAVSQAASTMQPGWSIETLLRHALRHAGTL